jgi:hypothetical protein
VLDRSASTEVTPARAAQAADLPSLTVVAVTIDCYETVPTEKSVWSFRVFSKAPVTMLHALYW